MFQFEDEGASFRKRQAEGQAVSGLRCAAVLYRAKNRRSKGTKPSTSLARPNQSRMKTSCIF